MSLEAINWALSLPPESVRGPARMVLMIMAHHYNDKMRATWPSVETIAAEAGLSTGQARNHIRKLEERGLIWIKAGTHAKGGAGCSRRYELAVNASPRPAPTTISENKEPINHSLPPWQEKGN
jgi:DNA-binding transcriptional MocR family regulator